MKRSLTARTWEEKDLVIAQCAEVDVASHGATEAEALANLREALELYFEPPVGSLTAAGRDDRGGGCRLDRSGSGR